MLLNCINITFFIYLTLLKINILNSFTFFKPYRKFISPNRLIYSHRMSNKRFFFLSLVCLFTRKYYQISIIWHNCFLLSLEIRIHSQRYQNLKSQSKLPLSIHRLPTKSVLLFTFYFLLFMLYYTMKELLYYHTQ